MILDEILADTIQGVEARKVALPLAELEEIARERTPAMDFTVALRGDSIKIVAEVKKASPSRGVIRADFNPVGIAEIYADNGASVISVLTEEKHFQGSLDYLRDVGNALGEKRVPLLRKDFIYDAYQVYESRAYGADSLLLIVAILKPEKLSELLESSHRMDMSCLVEVHNESELAIALNSGAKVIGINNRDLNTFKVDLATTRRLRPLIPLDRIVVSESGIKTREDIEKLAQWGVDAVLIGEALMDAPDIAQKMKELL